MRNINALPRWVANVILGCFPLFICLVILLFNACKKKEETTTVNKPKNYMSANINGTDQSVTFIDTSMEMSMGAISLHGFNSHIFMSVQFPINATTGTYDLTTNFPNYLCYYTIGQSQTYLAKSGTLKLDKVGASYEGTFEGIAGDQSNPMDSLIVTNGKFGFTP